MKTTILDLPNDVLWHCIFKPLINNINVNGEYNCFCNQACNHFGHKINTLLCLHCHLCITLKLVCRNFRKIIYKNTSRKFFENHKTLFPGLNRELIEHGYVLTIK